MALGETITKPAAWFETRTKNAVRSKQGFRETYLDLKNASNDAEKALRNF